MDRKTKEVALPFSTAMVAMAAMLGTQQAHVTLVAHEGGTDLVFAFAAKQGFVTIFKDERLVAATMVLVEGREPTNSAMSVVQESTTTDTVGLFDGRESGDFLVVTIVSDDGYSLDSPDVDLRCDDVAKVSLPLATILADLLELEVELTANVGSHIEEQRLQLAAVFGRQRAA